LIEFCHFSVRWSEFSQFGRLFIIIKKYRPLFYRKSSPMWVTKVIPNHMYVCR
jgi:hypothetical protein